MDEYFGWKVFETFDRQTRSMCIRERERERAKMRHNANKKQPFKELNWIFNFMLESIAVYDQNTFACSKAIEKNTHISWDFWIAALWLDVIQMIGWCIFISSFFAVNFSCASIEIWQSI